jgi:hypothetical protein
MLLAVTLASLLPAGSRDARRSSSLWRLHGLSARPISLTFLIADQTRARPAGATVMGDLTVIGRSRTSFFQSICGWSASMSVFGRGRISLLLSRPFRRPI